MSIFNQALRGCGIESDLWPVAFKTFIRHPSKQCRVHRLLQLGLIVGQCFIEELLHPIHFSMWSCNEAIKCDPHADNDVSQGILLSLSKDVACKLQVQTHSSSKTTRQNRTCSR